MSTTFADHLPTGDHASRPAASAVPQGSLYSCTDHTKVYQSDGSSTWSDWYVGSAPSAPAFAGARVTHNANQTIATATTTALAFNTERFDTDAYHDAVTNNSRLTVPSGKAGKYHIGGSIEWASDNTSWRMLQVQLNGTTVIASVKASPRDSTVWHMSIGTVYDLAEADYVELLVRQNTGGNLAVNATGNYSPEFYLSLLGA